MDMLFYTILVAALATVATAALLFIRRFGFRLPFRRGTREGVVSLAGRWFIIFFVLSGLALLALRFYTPNVLYAQNEQRLEAWQANSCVAPEAITESVFVATNKNLVGRATAFKLEGDVLVSNRHVAEALPEPLFVSPAVERYDVTLLHVADKQTRPDLAFFVTPQGRGGMATIPALPLAKEEPQLGEFLLVVGNNHQRTLFYPSVVQVIESAPTSWLTDISEAILGLYRGFSGENIYVDEGAKKSKSLNFDGDVAGGSSGSPVVNCAGEVVGVLYGGRALYWFANENTGSAVTLPDLRQELKELPAKNGQTPPLT